MYAVFNVTPGRQVKAAPGSTVKVDYFEEAKAGQKLVFDEVLLVSDGAVPKIGAPYVKAKVHATVVGHGRNPKVVVFKKKKRIDYHKQRGHKQHFTTLHIDSIEA
ncbi:50S ribosomal protein L21 [candidate division KSB1 bacterium]|nr:50S ribosomal protein L21 [candidate division KSB1 bacterium]